MIALFSPKVPATTTLMANGRAVTVTVRISARAKSYRLSLPNKGGPVLTLPRTGRWREAEAFLNRHAEWLATRLDAVPQAKIMGPNGSIPLRGVPHRLVATAGPRGRVTMGLDADTPTLCVPGGSAHFERRLLDWLKVQAKTDLEAAVNLHTGRLGVRHASITLRSQATRWGSCSSTGSLNFNWRLILAPPFVLDYVAAHEVAHLVEMNHAPAFWATVARTLPDFERGRAWLKTHGRELMSYGA